MQKLPVYNKSLTLNVLNITFKNNYIFSQNSDLKNVKLIKKII